MPHRVGHWHDHTKDLDRVSVLVLQGTGAGINTFLESALASWPNIDG